VAWALKRTLAEPGVTKGKGKSEKDPQMIRCLVKQKEGTTNENKKNPAHTTFNPKRAPSGAETNQFPKPGDL